MVINWAAMNELEDLARMRLTAGEERTLTEMEMREINMRIDSAISTLRSLGGKFGQACEWANRNNAVQGAPTPAPAPILTATATIQDCYDNELGNHIYVDVTWSGADLDRPNVDGFALKASHRGLARRLKKAIDAQAVYADPQVAKDVNGKTYVHAPCKVLGRHLNADLTRLGF